MIIFIYVIALYVAIGVVHGFWHLSQVLDRIQEAGEKEKALRYKVTMYDMSPSGASYFAELQELHISEALLLNEYMLYTRSKTKYSVVTFLFGTFLWVYYILVVPPQNRKVKQKNAIRLAEIEKTEV